MINLKVLINSLKSEDFRSKNTSYLRGYHSRSKDNLLLLPVSAITDYFRCPRCAYLRHVLHIPLANNQSVRGLLYHRAYEWFFSKEEMFVSMLLYHSFEFILQRFDDLIAELEMELKNNFQPIYKRMKLDYTSDWIELKEILKQKFKKWLEQKKLILRDFEKGKFIPERKFEVFLSSPTLGVRGKIDMIEDTIPIDIKTGKAPTIGVKLEHALQLAWYALLMEYRFNIDVNFGEVYYAQVDELRTVALDSKLRMLAFEVKDSAQEAFKKFIPPGGSCIYCKLYTRKEG
ncbi:MAG: PD-(D/E)XK nuclease family protein [Nitrososphaerales archaeon]